MNKETELSFSELNFIDFENMPAPDYKFEIGEDNYLTLYWGGYPYEYELSRIETPRHLLEFAAHVSAKNWKDMSARNLGAMVKAVAVDKGWFYTPERPAGEAPVPHTHKAEERAKMTHALRYEVLRRDGYRCRCCGLSVAQGGVLHVDHIVPVSKGGRTTKDNLQALCASCNLGKRDHD